MKNKLTLGMIALLICSGMVNAQNKTSVFKNLKKIYDNLNSLNGNLYFFNKYGTLDTNSFSVPELNESLGLIRLYSLKRVNINFDSLSYYVSPNRIKNEINFGKIIETKARISNDEAKYSTKLDSFFYSYKLRLRGTEQLPIDSFASIENLLLTSSHTNFIRQKVSSAQKKLLKILAIYENDKMLLIIYSIYIALNNSYINSELILR